MNHPMLTSQPSSSRRAIFSSIISAAVCSGLAVLLLTQEPHETAPALVPAHPVAAQQSAAPVTVPAVVPAAAAAVVTPVLPPAVEVKTPADMNRLADSDAPIEQKLASFTTAMRHRDAHTATEAARRAVYLIKSADYERLAGPLLLDTTLTPAAMQVLGLNVHDRDPGCTLPLLAKVSSLPGHPLQAEAADTIVFYLGESARALSGEPLEQAVSNWLKDYKVVAREP
jgi:hypothetical protein